MKNNTHYHFGIALSNLREEAIQLHRTRYLEVGFFKKGEIDSYEQDSLYFIAQETALNQVVGVTRLIFKQIELLPTIKNFEMYDLELAKLTKLEKRCYAEISAFTKLPKHEVGVHLIRTILHYSNQHAITHWIACIDERVFRYLNRIFSSIFKEIGVPKVYLGSTSVPCVVNLPEAMKQIKQQRPKLYEFLQETNEQVMEVLR